jgi:hypothetical protein
MVGQWKPKKSLKHLYIITPIKMLNKFFRRLNPIYPTRNKAKTCSVPMPECSAPSASLLPYKNLAIAIGKFLPLDHRRPFPAQQALFYHLGYTLNVPE